MLIKTQISLKLQNPNMCNKLCSELEKMNKIGICKELDPNNENWASVKQLEGSSMCSVKVNIPKGANHKNWVEEQNRTVLKPLK